MTDPQSIANWYRVNPRAHGPMLRHWLRVWPQFGASIAASREFVKPDKPQKHKASTTGDAQEGPKSAPGSTITTGVIPTPHLAQTNRSGARK
jgi:hypothetical protein